MRAGVWNLLHYTRSCSEDVRHDGEFSAKGIVSLGFSGQRFDKEDKGRCTDASKKPLLLDKPSERTEVSQGMSLMVALR
jgi:hypothetical protein